MITNDTSNQALSSLTNWAYAGLESTSEDGKLSDTMKTVLDEFIKTVQIDIDTVAEINRLAKENLTDEELGKQVRLLFTAFNQEF